MTLAALTRLDAKLDELAKQLAEKGGACERTHHAADQLAPPGSGRGRDYTRNPFIPPWAIGSGLGGLLTPGGNTGPSDPDPTNTSLPPDGSGG